MRCMQPQLGSHLTGYSVQLGIAVALPAGLGIGEALVMEEAGAVQLVDGGGLEILARAAFATVAPVHAPAAGLR